jgi:preprotein translocase subunit SecG
MMIFLTIIHVIVCLFLILVVLLQQGKSADWSGTFGGGSSQTAFGQRGSATLLSKATTAAAIIFMVTSLALTIISGRPGSRSVVPADAKSPTPVTTPAAPGAENKPAETAPPADGTTTTPVPTQTPAPAPPATPTTPAEKTGK